MLDDIESWKTEMVKKIRFVPMLPKRVHIKKLLERHVTVVPATSFDCDWMLWDYESHLIKAWQFQWTFSSYPELTFHWHCKTTPPKPLVLSKAPAGPGPKAKGVSSNSSTCHFATTKETRLPDNQCCSREIHWNVLICQVMLLCEIVFSHKPKENLNWWEFLHP